jgi:hypothetical protein
MNQKLLGLYGLKFNPFSPDLPTEALLQTKAAQNTRGERRTAVIQLPCG